MTWSPTTKKDPSWTVHPSALWQVVQQLQIQNNQISQQLRSTHHKTTKLFFCHDFGTVAWSDLSCHTPVLAPPGNSASLFRSLCETYPRKAKIWGTSEWQNNQALCYSYRAFSQELVRIVCPVLPSCEASRGLKALKQGGRSVAEYIIDFHLLSSESTWNEDALMDAFIGGLNEKIKDVLSTREFPLNLRQLEEMATQIDLRLTDRRRERGAPMSTSPHPRSGSSTAAVPARTLDPEPMQLGHTRLTPQERSRRHQLNLCLYCGRDGHRACLAQESRVFYCHCMLPWGRLPSNLLGRSCF
uniref:Retrotransposon gag domain-containing protein n=1 Tax=Fundulus heteroclitus TaxID=8078 RepID=A0A3Q2NSR9_FUNHE